MSSNTLPLLSSKLFKNNVLYTGDNLDILNGINSNSIDLIYIDPPFNSKRMYEGSIGTKKEKAGFKDIWKWDDVNEHYLDRMLVEYPCLVDFIRSINGIHSKGMKAYITYMGQRIIELHRVLKDTGSIYLHCDPTASHYIKIVMDKIFGNNNFRNEIIWHYQAGTSGKNYFKRKHDTILFYGSKNIFNRVSKPVVNSKRYNKKDKDGRLYDINGQGNKYYLDEGQTCDDVWTYVQEKQFQQLNSQAKEKTGYPTQKPLALIERIIKASSKEGDIVLDAFCGCATTLVKAQQLNRKWIGIDICEEAKNLVAERLENDAGFFSDFVHIKDTIPVRTDIVEIKKDDKDIKKNIYKEQQEKCNGCYNDYFIKDLEIDHILPRSKGGQNYKENYQLLCGSCNRIKGNRTMDYLINKIKIREKLFKKELSF